MTLDVPARVQAWRAAPHISARSVLVTILGDAVLPVARSVWLSQLFRLAEPFGFNTRLVRTSLFRLVEEGWVGSERVGRRSRYLLTPLAEREFGRCRRPHLPRPAARSRRRLDPRAVRRHPGSPHVNGTGWHDTSAGTASSPSSGVCSPPRSAVPRRLATSSTRPSRKSGRPWHAPSSVTSPTSSATNSSPAAFAFDGIGEGLPQLRRQLPGIPGRLRGAATGGCVLHPHDADPRPAPHHPAHTPGPPRVAPDPMARRRRLRPGRCSVPITVCSQRCSTGGCSGNRLSDADGRSLPRLSTARQSGHRRNHEPVKSGRRFCWNAEMPSR